MFLRLGGSVNWPGEFGKIPADRERSERGLDACAGHSRPPAHRAVLPLLSMVSPKTSPSPTLDPQLLERIRAATDTLELIAADRSALAVLSEDEHRRLRAAAARRFES